VDDAGASGGATGGETGGATGGANGGVKETRKGGTAGERIKAVTAGAESTGTPSASEAAPAAGGRGLGLRARKG